MRSILAAIIPVCMASFAAVPARAEMLDMSTVTCAQLAEMEEEQITWFLVWLDGWLAGNADDTTIDPDVIDEQANGIAEACEASPELSVMNAAKKSLE